MLKHILVPLDGSQLSESALTYGCQLVGNDGTLELLYVVELHVGQGYFVSDFPISDFTNTPENYEKLRKYAKAYLNVRVNLLHEDGYQATAVVQTGYPEHVIIELAKQHHVDAIVMATHSRSTASRFPFDSVTQRVLGGMPCPVMVVPNMHDTPEPTPEDDLCLFG